MRILLSGACGRMGRTVAELCRERDITVAAGVDVSACADELGFPVYPSFDAVNVKADVIVDFTRPEMLPELIDYALREKLPAVIATTGFNPADMKRIKDAAQFIPIFQSANMSLGINLLKSLIRQAAVVLGESFDVEIVERHHNRKIDAPSGTALMLFDELNKCYPGGREMVPGRESRTQARDHREIGVHAIRGGTLAGTHEVGFYGSGETLTIIHDAQNRTVFAQGAIAAAAFLKDKPAGYYAMDDLIRQMQNVLGS
jgi:4-hydroxy-tetrahydrodipicolinate reductase